MKKIRISHVDTVFANGSYPIEFFFFFPGKIDSAKIKKALQKSAKLFWPVFGIYHDGLIIDQKYDEQNHYRESIMDEPFPADASEKYIYDSFKGINPKFDEKLFYITVIQFPNGTAIIPKMSHLAGDGYSYFYFISVLSAITASLNNPVKLLGIRQLYKPDEKRTVFKDFNLKMDFNEFSPEDEELKLEYTQIPKKQIKQHIYKCKDTLQDSVSANDVLCAYVLKKFADLKIFKENIWLSMPIDIRKYFKAYGPKYFGNALLFSHNSYSVAEINKLSVEKLATAIRKNTPPINDKSYLEFLNGLEQKIINNKFNALRPYDPLSGCLVTNLSKMPTARINFGSGKPAIVSTITKGKNSAAVLADDENYILRMMF